jgi:GPH family glycoside/pentoside/hexuronide:cation symporter
MSEPTIAAKDTSLRKDKIGIAFGHFGYNLGAAVIMTFITYFLTDNMLISAASVSLILLVSRIIDAITDLWMGSLIDRCKSKLGKARPWLIWMAAPAVISMGLLFTVPPFNETGRIVYSFITYNLFAFFYMTALALPVNALVALITSNMKSRLVLSQISGFFMTLGAVFMNYFSTPAITWLSGGTPNNMGYFLYFTGIALIGVIFMIICFTLTKERAQEELESKEKKVPFKIAAPAVLKNKYWWNGMGIWLVTNLVPACWAATFYYCIYWTNNQVDGGQLMALLWGGITAGILVFIPISRKIGKANSAALGLCLQAIGSVMLWFAPTSIAMVWISTVFRSVGVGGLSGYMNAMLADVVEYGDWKTGIRSEGMIYSGASFGAKVGSGLGGAVVAGLLAWGGYDALAAEQTVKALTSIKVAFIAAPFVGTVLIIVLLLLFRVEKLMPKIKAELEERRKQSAT